MARTKSSSDKGNAIDMLMNDHKRMQKLFKNFENLDRDDDESMRDIVATACIELQIHSMLEEEIFYPAVRAQVNDGENEDLLNEAEVEHESADELIAKLHEIDADDPMYPAYFTVLGEYVKHHIREEEKELFPEVRKMIGLDLRQLGEDMRRRRDDIRAELESGEERESAVDATQADELATSHAGDDETEDEQEVIDISRTRH